jgi:hypothetical protein
MSAWHSIHVNPHGFFRYRTNDAGALEVLNANGNAVTDPKTLSLVAAIAKVSDKVRASRGDGKDRA